MILPSSDAESAEVSVTGWLEGEIVHAIAGRIRIRLPLLSSNASCAIDLEQRLRSLPPIHSFSLNTVAASLTLYYDPTQWEDTMVPPAGLLAVLEQHCSLRLRVPLAIAPVPTSDPLTFDATFAQTQLRRVGGALIGGAAGDAVGGVVGATAGALVLGPAGMILGGQIGVFVGGVIGAQVGAETLHYVDHITRTATTNPGGLTLEKLTQSIQRRAGERIGETTGQVTGGLMGRVILGPTGQIVGAIVGGVIGGQLGEEAAKSTLPSPAQTPANQSSLAETQQWAVRTTQRFVNETATITIGGAVGRMVLGPAGQAIGVRIGDRIAKVVEWHPEDTRTPAGDDSLTLSVDSPTAESTAQENKEMLNS